MAAVVRVRKDCGIPWKKKKKSKRGSKKMILNKFRVKKVRGVCLKEHTVGIGTAVSVGTKLIQAKIRT